MPAFRLANTSATIAHAGLELYHLDSPEADWNLAITVDGAIERLVLSGTVPSPALPGPAKLEIHHVDEPSSFEHQGEQGSLTTTPDSAPLELHQVDGKTSIRGRTQLWWTAVGESNEQRTLELELDLEPTLETW